MSRLYCAMVLLAIFAVTAEAAAAEHPSQLQIVNLAQRADTLTVRMCRENETDCTSSEIKREGQANLASLPAGLYRFEIWSDGRKVDRFRYGLAGGDNYSLAIYGIATPSAKPDLWSRLALLLGGSDKRVVAGYRLRHRMFSRRPGDKDAAATIRIANLAPGAAALHGRIDRDEGSQSLGLVKYGAASEKLRLDRTHGQLVLTFQDSLVPLLEKDMAFPPGSATMVYICAVDRAGLDAVIDQTHP